MTDFQGVVQAWREADPRHIHPTREHESEQAYWESGRAQAELVLELVGVGGTVLDFGCGDGRIAIPMSKLGLVVYAVDAAPEMLQRVEAQTVGDNPIITVLSDGTTDLAKLIGPVDAVNARAVFIHHAHADVAAMVYNLAACIKPGGYLIADWPLGGHHERVDWIDVTTWDAEHRAHVAAIAGLELVSEGEPRVRPSIWVKLP